MLIDYHRLTHHHVFPDAIGFLEYLAAGVKVTVGEDSIAELDGIVPLEAPEYVEVLERELPLRLFALQ